jgi:hypothetical protein
MKGNNPSGHFSEKLARLVAMLAVVLVAVAVAPGQAAAQTSKELTRYLPQQEQIVVGVNFGELRKSKYFDDVLALAKNTAGGGAFLALLADANIDIATDIKSLALSMPDDKIRKNIDMKRFTVALSGTFEQAKLLEALKSKKVAFKSKKSGKKAFYSKEDVVFTFPKEGVLWLASGPDAYRKNARSALKDAKNSVRASAFFKSLIDGVKTTRGLWMLADAASAGAGSISTQGSAAKSVAMSLDVSSGLALQILMEMASEKAAAATLARITQQAKEAAKNPMAVVMGIGPLLTNLKTTRTGTRVVSATSMTAAEFDTLIQRAGQVLMAKLNGGGAISAPAKSSSTPGTGSSSKSGSSKSGASKKDASKQGANADFN